MVAVWDFALPNTQRGELLACRGGEWHFKLFNWISQQKNCLPLWKLKKIWEACEAAYQGEGSEEGNEEVGRGEGDAGVT